MKKTKLILILTLVLGAFQWAFAAPLKNIPVRLTQPDGEVIECFASGDEFYNYLHDANGFTIVKGVGGYYCYAMHDSRGEVVASTYRVNSVDPASVGLMPYVKISEKAYMQRRQEREQNYQPVKQPANRELNHGRFNNLVVFIRFAGDSYHVTPYSAVDSMFNASNYDAVSLRNYFHHATYNQLDIYSYLYPSPDGETILSYEDIYPKEYYMPYDSVTNLLGYQDEDRAEREFSLIERAIYYIADQVSDTLDLDYNEDGNVDNVVFVIKGQPGAWNSLLWPHRWWIFDRDIWLKGLRVYDFNLQLEIGDYFNVSTLCHEMNHSLGAPDLYHYSTGVDAIGSWDLMGSNASPPQHMGMYMKYKYGNWIDDIPEITEYGTYELEATSWEGNRRNVYRIASSHPFQYYVIEHRDDKRMFDESLPDGGLLIYRIDTRYDGNAGYNGEDYFDEVYVFRPNGDPQNAGNLDRAAYSADRSHIEFNYTTNPAPFLTNGQPDERFSIYNVSSRGDRMSFTFGPADHETIPQNLITHVDVPNHQVVLRWDQMADAESYAIYRDGELLADGITEAQYSHAYTSDDNGYHTYRVTATVDGDESVLSDPQWIILGNYENLKLSLTTNSPFGTKGGEVAVTFDNGMPTKYLTIYEGGYSEAEYCIPANTEVTLSWIAGFDPESEGIHLTAKRFNQNEESLVIDAEQPQAGVLVTYTVADNGLGLTAPQHVNATSNGQSIIIDWTIPTENTTFDIYRGGRKVKSASEGYNYVDDKIMRSGTYYYHVETSLNGVSTWHPEQCVYANAMNYYCEPPRNLEGTYDNGNIELSWEAPEFYGQGLLAYDDNEFIDQIGSNSTKWGIKMEPEIMAHFEGHPLTHIELFDCSAGRYTFTIYNGDVTNSSTTLYVQTHNMEGSQEFVRFALDEPVPFDPSLPLWICVSTANAQKPIPCCNYVGEDNSCLVKASGNSWRPAPSYGMYRTWLLRGYTSPIESSGDFTYNVYWGPEEGSVEQLDLGYEALPATQASYNTTENQRYNVTAIWDGRETELSNTIYLGPSVGIEEILTADQTLEVYPNPVKDHLTLHGEGIQQVSLYTITGVCVFESTANHNAFEVDMSSLPQGMYILRVLTKDGNVARKVVKE